ncbi:MFS transporter [Pedobacter psychrotolerans]|uniref:MFS transporter n=1 Tax=Pedobacter psychrotolerans TaxID=1843235 RepID=A0A4R2HP41_9SPHI|nr:MFS transporter [Pedobacter psychrotolerans]TCO31114.1 MFS transporter [Pedobacter psychrotolerans]GGE42120.1 MFS transporter [Pedobacter psychrotolerans]
MTFFTIGDFKKIIVLLILSATVFLSVLDIFIVNVALPSIERGIKATGGDLQLVVAAYLMAYAALMISASKLGDRLGRKKILLVGLIGFGISSLLCGLVETPFQLIIIRALQGACGALMVPQGLALLQQLFTTEKERSWALGIYGSIAGIASVLGQLLGGLLPAWSVSVSLFGDEGGWRLIFLINVPITILVTFLTILYIPKVDKLKSERFDYVGLFLLTIFLLSLIFPLIRGREMGWPLWSIMMLGLSFPIWKLLWFQQRAVKDKGFDSLVNFDLFKNITFKLGVVLSLFYFIAQDSYFLITGFFLQNGLSVSSVSVGILFVFQGIGYVIGSFLSARLIKFYGEGVISLGLMIMIFSLIGHLFAFNSGKIGVLQFMLLALYGLGCGSVLPSLLTLSLKNIDIKHAGSASGIYSTVQQTAIALGVALVGGLFFYVLQERISPGAFIEAYRAASFMNIIFLTIVLGILKWFPKNQL